MLLHTIKGGLPPVDDYCTSMIWAENNRFDTDFLPDTEAKELDAFEHNLIV